MARNELILASQSTARQKMLVEAGLKFTAIPAILDEMAVAKEMISQNLPPQKIASELARKKALTVAGKNPDALVIGSDQILVLDGEIMSKARTIAEAKEKLKKLRGKTHKLISAVAVAKAGTVFWSEETQALLTMHDFNDEFLESYCEKAGEALTRAVGAYEIESTGAWLFSEVKGDLFTILGMPLVPLLCYLREYQGFKP
ncbi:MAG: Maf family nucleotide pyrophosphatase [Alphaproteobacteria bacterium]